MSQLPSQVSTDADPTEGQTPGQLLQQHHGNGSSRTPRPTRPVPRDIRSVDSGYSETSASDQGSLSQDAVPSNPPSLSSLNLHPPPSSSSVGQVSSGPTSSGHLDSSQFVSQSQYGSSQFGSSVDTVSDIQGHLVHRINRAVGGKGKKFEEEDDSSSKSLPPISSSSTFSSSSSSSSSCVPSSSSSSMPCDDADSVTDADIDALRKEMPYQMRVDFQDAMVLFCEEDREKVDLFMENFEGMKLFDRISPKVMLYDDMAVAIGSQIKALEFGIDRCTYVFLYVTKLFCDDAWSEFSSETCLMEAIHNPSKKWCVVPVFTEPKRSASFRVPPSLNSLKGIQYWTNDKFFKDSVKKLLEEKLFLRRKNEKELTRKRKEWVVSHRVEKMKEEVQEKKEMIALQRREQIAREETMAQRSELERRQYEQELRHQMELQKIKEEQEQSQGMKMMMKQFAERFNVPSSSSKTNVSFPGLGSSKSDEELFQHLRRMFGQQNNPQSGFPSANQTPSNVHQVSLGQGGGLASGRSFQETAGSQASDEGSTGFNPGNIGTSAEAYSQNTQYFSMPSQSAQGISPAFQSLPSNLQTASQLGSESFSRGDLEEDQPPSLYQHSSSSPDLISASQQAAIQKAQDHSRHPQGHPSVPDARTFSGAQSQSTVGRQSVVGPQFLCGPQSIGEAQSIGGHPSIVGPQGVVRPQSVGGSQSIAGAGVRTGHVPDPPANAKEIHYHYHYYDKNPKQSRTKGAPEKPPINIVGAKIVQIGDGNLVQVDDEFMKGGEETRGHAGDADSSDEDVEQHKSQPGTASKPVVSIPSQPPSTIYQDNNPSVPYRGSSPRPVQLPTRDKDQGLPLHPSRPSAHPATFAGNPAAASSPAVASAMPHGSHILPQGTVSKGPAFATTVPKVAASLTPVEGSVGPTSAQGSFVSQGQTSIVGPLSSGPMAGLANETSCASHPGGPQIALVKPMGAQGLLGRGCEETEVKGVAAQSSSSPPPQTEYDSIASQTAAKGLQEGDPCEEQTLAKMRALESEID